MLILNIPRGRVLVIQDITIDEGINIRLDKKNLGNIITSKAKEIVTESIGNKGRNKLYKITDQKLSQSIEPLFSKIVTKIPSNESNTLENQISYITQYIRSLLHKNDYYVSLNASCEDTLAYLTINITTNDGEVVPLNSITNSYKVQNEESVIINAFSRLLCETYSPISAILSDYSLPEDINYSSPVTWDFSNIQRDTILFKNELLSSTSKDNKIAINHIKADFFWQLSLMDDKYYAKAIETYQELALLLDDSKKKDIEKKIETIITEQQNEIVDHKTILHQILKKYEKKLNDCEQLLVAFNSKFHETKGVIYLFSKTNGNWNLIQLSKNNLVNFGKKGIAKYNQKQEGDLKAPSGIFSLTHYFSRDTNITSHLNRIDITKHTVWVDDPTDAKYNTYLENIDGIYNKKSEPLFRRDSLYNYVIVINYNTKNIPYKGSAIFIHCSFGDTPTAGCLSLPQNDIIKYLKWLNVSKNPMIIIGSLEQNDILKFD